MKRAGEHRAEAGIMELGKGAESWSMAQGRELGQEASGKVRENGAGS